jgi:ribosomal protein S27AE
MSSNMSDKINEPYAKIFRLKDDNKFNLQFMCSKCSNTGWKNTELYEYLGEASITSIEEFCDICGKYFLISDDIVLKTEDYVPIDVDLNDFNRADRDTNPSSPEAKDIKTYKPKLIESFVSWIKKLTN